MGPPTIGAPKHDDGNDHIDPMDSVSAVGSGVEKLVDEEASSQVEANEIRPHTRSADILRILKAKFDFQRILIGVKPGREERHLRCYMANGRLDPDGQKKMRSFQKVVVQYLHLCLESLQHKKHV